jgi:hypothetical protein
MSNCSVIVTLLGEALNGRQGSVQCAIDSALHPLSYGAQEVLTTGAEWHETENHSTRRKPAYGCTSALY